MWRSARVRGLALWVAAAAAAAAAAAGCSTELLHGVDERSANESVSTLERAGIDADKVVDDTAGAGGPAAVFAVRVARADGARALDVLRAAGLPRDRRRGFAETYGQPSLIPTASEERARFLGALAGEIERTLESVDGVVTARVHLVPDELDPMAIDRVAPAGGRARAAVLLKTRGHDAPLAVADVQRLVAGSVPGLEPAQVAVVSTPAADGAPPAAPDAALAAVGPLRVSPGSRPLLLAGVALGLCVLAALAGLLLVTSRRLAAMERERGRAHRDDETRASVQATPSA